MARTKSARKAKRVSERRRIFNVRRKSTMKDSVKKLRKMIDAKSVDSLKNFSEVQQAIDKASKNGSIKKNTAARIKSRIAKKLKALA